MNDWLNLADVHLLPQKANAADLVLPSKLLGMLASGRPVVTSSPKESELGRMVAQVGIRVEPEDPGGYTRAIRELVEDETLRARLGAKGRAMAESCFGQKAIMQKFQSFLLDFSRLSIHRALD